MQTRTLHSCVAETIGKVVHHEENQPNISGRSNNKPGRKSQNRKVNKSTAKDGLIQMFPTQGSRFNIFKAFMLFPHYVFLTRNKFDASRNQDLCIGLILIERCCRRLNVSHIHLTNPEQNVDFMMLKDKKIMPELVKNIHQWRKKKLA